MKNDASRTSPRSDRYLTIAGMNQVKSNLRSSGRRPARLVSRMSCPLQIYSKAWRWRIRGLGARPYESFIHCQLTAKMVCTSCGRWSIAWSHVMPLSALNCAIAWIN